MKASAFTENSSLRFGTSGLRGLVADFNEAPCFAYTQAFLKTIKLLPGQTLALGMDLRPSSPAILTACAAAAAHWGARVDFCGCLPTPALAYYAAKNRFPAIMITGSHIPFDRNGIKFYRAEGEISKTDETAIGEADVALPETFACQGRLSENNRALLAYEDRYVSFFPQNSLDGMRIGFYQHSSAARDLLTRILERLGARVVPLGRTDDFIPIDTEAVKPQDIERAKKWAEKGAFDALVSTDGDADRPLLADRQGRWLRGDMVGLLAASFFEADAVVTTLHCNTALERCRRFSYTRRTRIGSPYVIEGMLACRAKGYRRVVGFEPNGGFILGSDIARDGRTLDALMTRDAALPILCALTMANRSKSDLADMVGTFPSRFTASDCLPYPDQNRAALDVLISKVVKILFEQSPSWEVDRTDGLRVRFENEEIVHLRPSGNAPELRIYVEADSQARADAMVRGALCAAMDVSTRPIR